MISPLIQLLFFYEIDWLARTTYGDILKQSLYTRVQRLGHFQWQLNFAVQLSHLLSIREG